MSSDEVSVEWPEDNTHTVSRPFRDEDFEELALMLDEGGIPGGVDLAKRLVSALELEVEVNRYGAGCPDPSYHSASRWVTLWEKDQ